MSPQAAKPIRGTILVLHGFAQNGSNFAIKASGIRKMLKKAGYQTVFIDGPLKLSEDDMPFEVKKDETPFEDLNLRGWTYTQPGKFNINPAFDTVKAAYKEHGPFVGLMGFSQGAGVVGALLPRYGEVVGNKKADDELKFAILYSGFRYKDESMESYYKDRITVPTLHLMGELDTVVGNDRSNYLAELCDNTTTLKHPGGHYVPSTKDLLRKEVAWIEEVMNGKYDEPSTDDAAKNDAEAKKEIDDLAAELSNLGKA